MMIVLAVLPVTAAGAVMPYNGLVQLEHNVARAWSNIDVLLKQRHDELSERIGLRYRW
jgi:LemA protein